MVFLGHPHFQSLLIFAVYIVERALPCGSAVIQGFPGAFGFIFFSSFLSINKLSWCKKGFRPSVPCHHIKEHRYVYGAVEPLIGESSFLIVPYCNTECMNIFLDELSKQYPDTSFSSVVMELHGESLCIPNNIELFFIPPYTIWDDLRESRRKASFT